MAFAGQSAEQHEPMRAQNSVAPTDRITSGRVSEFAELVRAFIVNVKKVGTAAAIVGAVTIGAFGIGAGVASADKPHWNDWDGGGHGHRGDWDGWRDGPVYTGPAYYGPCVWVPPAVAVWVPPAVC